jgi:iron-sulfur cluster assembly accessory protein
MLLHVMCATRVLFFLMTGRAEARPSATSAWFDLTQRRDNFVRPMINVTDNAVRQLRALLEGQAANERKGLRVQIARGGCSGLQYEMSLDAQKAGDSIVEKEGVEFLVDSESADYLRGATLDYRDGLTGTGFHIENPNAARTCGCGTSFEAARSA